MYFKSHSHNNHKGRPRDMESSLVSAYNRNTGQRGIFLLEAEHQTFCSAFGITDY